MRGRVLTVAATLAGLWASSAWSATDAVPSNDDAVLTLVPGNALTTPAGVSDPNFPAGNLATILLEPPATTIPFRLVGNGVTASGLLSDNLSLTTSIASDLSAQAAWSLRDIMLSAALAPGIEVNFAQGRDLAAMGAFGGGANPEDSLFLSSPGARSPYLSLTDGGVYAGITAHLADNLQLRIGHATLGLEAAGRQSLLAGAGLSALPPDLALRLAADGRSASTTAAAIDWNFADWGGLDVTASHSSESNSLLGDVTSAPIAVVNAAETAALGISARVGFGAGWVTTVSYNQGLTQLNLRSSGFAPSASTISSTAYGITVAKEGLFGNDTLGLSLSRPLQFSGTTSGFLADSNGNLLLNGNNSLLGDAPESDIELGYVTSFLGGSLALQANAAYQMNAGGQRGQGAVAVVSRAKINF